MNWLARLSALTAVVAFPALGAVCPPAPVRDSEQAVCYAMAYADRNGLPRKGPAKTQVTKGKELWTVRHVNTRQGQRGSGWEVEVDAASAKVIRFTSYKGER